MNRPVEVSSYHHHGEPILNRRLSLTNRPKVAELFCGCGGFSTGFEWAGFESVLGVDIHAPSLATFGLNHPHTTTLLGDLTNIDGSMVLEACGRRPDVVLAGIPCQGFSLNNRKRHSGDRRNYLFEDLLRFVKALDPSAVVVENVTGLRSTRDGEFVQAIEEGLRGLGFGWVGHKLLNAAHFGVPQTRSRLVFVACKSEASFQWPRATHGVGAVPFVSVEEAIGDLPAVASGECSDRYGARPQTAYQRWVRGDTAILLNHGAPKHPESTIARIAATKPGTPMYSAFKQRIRLNPGAPSPTQVSGGIRPQFQFGHPSQARGLTVRERCRLQSFPDSYFVEGGVVQGRVQTGNAVPPLLARAIGEALFGHLLREGLIESATKLATSTGRA